MDLDESIGRVREASLQELTLTDIVLPDRSRVGRAQIDSPEDALLFADVMRTASQAERPNAALARVERRRAQLRAASDRLAATGALRLSNAIADHLGDPQLAKVERKNYLDSRHALRVFAGIVVKDLPVSAVTRDQVRVFVDAVECWPKNTSKPKPYRDLSVLEIIELPKANGEPEPVVLTVSKPRQRLNVFFISLVASQTLDRKSLSGIRAISTPDADDKGGPVTDVQLQAIFDPVAFPAWAKKYPHLWFGTILGLYSGARVSEIAQLRVADIDIIDGVSGFFIRSGRTGQRIKNKNSRRFVPLAQPVLYAGFLTYVEEAKQAGHDQLFQNLPNSTGLGYGWQLSRQFSDYIKSRGITAIGQGFHGFRHTIASEFDEACASASAIGALTRHGAGQSALDKYYTDRRTLPDRVATLAKLSASIKNTKIFIRAIR